MRKIKYKNPTFSSLLLAFISCSLLPCFCLLNFSFSSLLGPLVWGAWACSEEMLKNFSGFTVQQPPLPLQFNYCEIVYIYLAKFHLQKYYADFRVISPRLGKPVQEKLDEMRQIFPPLRNYLGNSPKYYPMWFARHDTHLSSKHRILPWWYDYFWRGFSEVRIELFKSVKIDRLNNRLNQTDYPLGT